MSMQESGPRGGGVLPLIYMPAARSRRRDRELRPVKLRLRLDAARSRRDRLGTLGRRTVEAASEPPKLPAR
jgi:hypothetical protein